MWYLIVLIPGLCRLSYIVYLLFGGETTWGEMRNDKGMGANRLRLNTEARQLEGKRLSEGGGGVLGAKRFSYQSTAIKLRWKTLHFGKAESRCRLNREA